MADDGTFGFVLASDRRLADHSVLQVGIQTLVRVRLGTVGRQVEDLDLLLENWTLDQPRTLRVACGRPVIVVLGWTG
jgi:hypothetical protein